MRNVLSANLLRLRKSRLFWSLTAFSALFSAYYMTASIRDAAERISLGYVDVSTMDSAYFVLAPFLGILFSVFLSLYLGTDYSDGTIRNRLVVGSGRGGIYCANLLTSVLACFTMTAAWLLGGLVGLLGLEPWRCGRTILILYFLNAFGIALALAALFNFLGTLCTRKSIGAVLAILLFLALLMAGSYFYNALCEPEMASEMFVTTNGIEIGDPVPNPAYIGGTLRAVYERILWVLPTGQSILLANGEIARPVFQIIASLALSAVLSAAGAALFRKKDLK